MRLVQCDGCGTVTEADAAGEWWEDDQDLCPACVEMQVVVMVEAPSEADPR